MLNQIITTTIHLFDFKYWIISSCYEYHFDLDFGFYVKCFIFLLMVNYSLCIFVLKEVFMNGVDFDFFELSFMMIFFIDIVASFLELFLPVDLFILIKRYLFWLYQRFDQNCQDLYGIDFEVIHSMFEIL